tara:strand:- start:179 stop:328 length:150 start_codon:yes stop_codon:yes gene_type:complete
MNKAEEKKEITIQKPRPKKNKKKLENQMRNNPMYFIFGEQILIIDKNKI